ncbi:hypothetical protein SC08_Contig83orf00566 [Clostridium butyricum]|nr:hypothetical protein SC08_Contig83orf00566 [Clostridium butyricum]
MLFLQKDISFVDYEENSNYNDNINIYKIIKEFICENK